MHALLAAAVLATANQRQSSLHCTHAWIMPHPPPPPTALHFLLVVVILVGLCDPCHITDSAFTVDVQAKYDFEIFGGLWGFFALACSLDFLSGCAHVSPPQQAIGTAKGTNLVLAIRVSTTLGHFGPCLRRMETPLLFPDDGTKPLSLLKMVSKLLFLCAHQSNQRSILLCLYYHIRRDRNFFPSSVPSLKNRPVVLFCQSLKIILSFHDIITMSLLLQW